MRKPQPHCITFLFTSPSSHDTPSSLHLLASSRRTAPSLHDLSCARDLSANSDVFNFGILLLEIISGRHGWHSIDVNYSSPSVVDWAVPLIKHDEICDYRINSRIQLSKPSRTCSTSSACVLRPPSSWPVE
jgi:hypothetical protein